MSSTFTKKIISKKKKKIIAKILNKSLKTKKKKNPWMLSLFCFFYALQKIVQSPFDVFPYSSCSVFVFTCLFISKKKINSISKKEINSKISLFWLAVKHSFRRIKEFIQPFDPQLNLKKRLTWLTKSKLLMYKVLRSCMLIGMRRD